MELKLKRPIAFFDLETTGINVVSDRIVEISILKIGVNGEEEVFTQKVNPLVHIPEQASDIHGIYDKDVAGMPTFKEIARKIANMIKDCDIAGYNSNRFDVPLLAEELLRADVDFDFSRRKFVDVQVIFMKKEQRTLSAAYQFYCNKELNDAHSAEADTKATYEILKSQLDMYRDLENDTDFLSEFSSHTKNVDFAGRVVYDDNGNEIFNFGKHKGKKVEDVFAEEPGYYSWMMNAEFPLNTKQVLTKIKLKSFNA